MSGIPLTAINGGMNRLRVKGAARRDTLYQLTNGYVTAGSTVKVRPGTIRNVDLAATTGAGTTKGLVAYGGSRHIFSDHVVPVPPGYTLHVLSHPAVNKPGPAPVSANNASMLLHFEEGNGSTTFTDSAGITPAPVWTATGAGVQETTARSKFGTGSLTIPSTAAGLYISTPAASLGNIDFRFGCDFTIECFAYLTAWGANGNELWCVEDSTNVTKEHLYVTATGAMVFNIPSSVTMTSAAAAFPLNQWNHVAFTRYGSFLTVWVNGVSVVTSSRANSIMTAWAAGTLFKIGGVTTAAYGAAGFNGNIDEFRMVVGQAVYTAAFTPPTSALTAAVANAGSGPVTLPSLLHFDDGGGSTAFTDSGANPLTWTAHNTVGTAAESTAQVKFGTGSLLISSTDAAIIAPQNTGGSLDLTSGDWTVELWCYPTAQTKTLLDTSGNFVELLDFSANNTTLFNIKTIKTAGVYKFSFNFFGANGWSGMGTGNIDSLTINAWNHVAVMRRNDMISFAINGNMYYTSNTGGAPTGNPPALPGAGNSAYVGARFNIPGYGTAGWSGGHIDDVVVTKGVAKYGGVGSAYTLPTAPAAVVPLTVPIPLKEIHFAAPFMGFLYAAAEFTDDGGSGLGTVFHYWLQTSGTWKASTNYQVGQIVSPSVANGMSFRAERVTTPSPKWAASTLKAASDKVEPSTPNGFLYTATAVDGSNPITGTTEPTWPVVAGAVVYEESEKTDTGEVATPAPQPSATTPSPGTGGKYINPYRGLLGV